VNAINWQTCAGGEMSKSIGLVATIIILILAATESRRHLAFAPIPILCQILCGLDLADMADQRSSSGWL
jgi:hypothetical protein